MQINILHLSDLHIKKTTTSSLERITKGLFRDLNKLKAEHDVGVNLVLFAGDLVSEGDKTEGYDLAEEVIIAPLLKELKLTSNQLFFVPGNHEVARSQISDVIEAGLHGTINSKEGLAKFLENERLSPKILPEISKKFEAFTNFKNKVGNNNRLSANVFVDAYKIDFGKFKVGILCLNSAWLCSAKGTADDKGKLIVSPDVFESAVNIISTCDFKIAVAHHPLESLSEWNQRLLRDLMARNINLFFTGHAHDSDFTHLKPILGQLYICIGAALDSARASRKGYSLTSMDLERKSLTIYLRKWYEDRGEFDQETEKCAQGIIHIKEFRTNNPDTEKLLEINKIKNRLRENRESTAIFIIPISEINKVELQEVFVEPLISDTPNYEKGSNNKKKYFELDSLLKKDKNLVFVGGKECGKTVLLNSIKEKILTNDDFFEDKVPVVLNFYDLPKNNPESIIRLIANSLQGSCQEEQLKILLRDGNFALMIDDYDSVDDPDRQKKRESLISFYKNYSANRFVLSIREGLSEAFRKETLILNELLNGESYFLASLNTSKIREILKKWQSHQTFDVEIMLQQILFYFRQLEIPVTPLSVTLFIGVLFKDSRAKKNIRNEAYLIENYCEQILEKSRSVNSYHLDFRDQESFLAHLALTMVRSHKAEYPLNDFEKIKLEYFSMLGEDVPKNDFFQDFFDRLILQEANGKISFNFKFWFNFFLAKAMQGKDEVKQEILSLPYYLKYSTALAYKAGLSRNDDNLLKTIDDRASIVMKDLVLRVLDKEVGAIDFDATFLEIEKEIENEIKEKNSSAEKDSVRDEMYLTKAE
ncbi:MAG: metallophosphoesterase, partial [Smithella sp.]